MKFFTYHNYIDCIHKLRLNAILKMAEEGEEYNIINKKDKTIKKILENTEEVEKLINNFLSPNEKVKKEELQRWKRKYITNKYKNDKPILIYKQKGTETFFLIEHVENMDASISYKILNYCVDIIYEWSKNKKFNSKSKYPKVVPIIIYTGKEKWKIPINFEEKRIGTTVLENYKIDIGLNVIETNRLKMDFLENQKSLFRKHNNRREFQIINPFSTPFHPILHKIP